MKIDMYNGCCRREERMRVIHVRSMDDWGCTQHNTVEKTKTIIMESRGVPRTPVCMARQDQPSIDSKISHRMSPHYFKCFANFKLNTTIKQKKNILKHRVAL